MRITLIIIGVLLILLLFIYLYHDGFKKISIKIESQGGEIMVYEEVKGSYHQTPKITDKIYHSLLNEDQVKTTKGVGIFYDDPKEVDNDELRSEVGCILPHLNQLTISKLSKKYLLKTIPAKEYLVVEFPFKSSLSVLIGMMQVYPAINDYCIDNEIKEGPVTEIYDVLNKKIIYRKELLK